MRGSELSGLAFYKQDGVFIVLYYGFNLSI